jgi:O-6-methylguanine DNA methyltransferase
MRRVIFILKLISMHKTFRERVYEIASHIPRGKVATYKQLATLAGNMRASRAVGMYMKCNPHRHIVPCHRVVASSGALTGYSFGRGVITKKKLLQREGVLFSGERVSLVVSQWHKK